MESRPGFGRALPIVAAAAVLAMDAGPVVIGGPFPQNPKVDGFRTFDEAPEPKPGHGHGRGRLRKGTRPRLRAWKLLPSPVPSPVA